LDIPTFFYIFAYGVKSKLKEMEAYQYKIRKEQEVIEKENISFNINDISLLNTKIELINSNIAKEVIFKYEWLKTMPLFNKYYFGIYFSVNNEYHLGGVVIYSEEYSSNKATTWDKYEFTNKIILLSRGVCLWWTPKNTASYFISKTTDWIKANTEYKIITATVDPAAGEIGTIYQSLNWKYIGLMSGNYNKNGMETKRFSVFINGKLKHSRTIRKEFGTISKNVILSKYPNAIFLPQYRKRRYFYFIGNKSENKKYLKNINHLILPYPKRNDNIVGVIYLILNKINNKKYIGQTTRGFNERYYEYKTNAKCCSPYVLKAFTKYGFNNFDFSIIDTAQTIDELNYKEVRHIFENNTTNRNLGYNIELGGKNSPTNSETTLKLSNLRKEVKQTKEWINKRVAKISKPVLKVNGNIIFERYNSLADAGKNNNDSLSYGQIMRKCLGYSKNTDDLWCYEDDYLKNKIKTYSPIQNKLLSDFTNAELKSIYNDHIKYGISIRELSEKHSICFSTLNHYFSKINKPIIINFTGKYTLTCKKTGRKFIDYLNKSGILTTHILETYPNLLLESKFKRKQIEIKTGLPWYYDYFEFIDNNK
jgi:group I intron endonuclease